MSNYSQKFNKLKKCPICESKSLVFVSKIHSDIKKVGSKYDLLKCKNCLHRVISEIPKENFLKNLYKNESSMVIGDRHNQSRLKQKFIDGRFSKVMSDKKHWVLDYVDIKKGNYFELGPGFCNLYKRFHEMGWKCQGVELRSFIKAPGIKKDINKISNNHSNVAVALDVLEHVSDPIKYLKNINKKLKKGGKIFLTFPHSESYKSKILKDRWLMVSPLSHLHYFSMQSTKIMLRKSGFKIFLIKDFSLIQPRRLIRNFLKLPLLFLKDIFGFNFKKIFLRIEETMVNFLDLLKGDQLKVIAIKSNRLKN